MTKLREGETYSTDGPECPQCGRQFTVDEGYYYDADNYTSDTCDDCGTKFQVEVHHSVSWTCTMPEAADSSSPSATEKKP